MTLRAAVALIAASATALDRAEIQLLIFGFTSLVSLLTLLLSGLRGCRGLAHA